jgi:hypothetical protein
VLEPPVLEPPVAVLPATPGLESLGALAQFAATTAKAMHPAHTFIDEQVIAIFRVLPIFSCLIGIPVA